ncbi:hypothetical protein ACH5RR_013087 [Cinchona calisaya]|uniref:RNase H type-1 domain-containing protein n=1 Tax=Cinchona calisaya TaxID=153742 RepID=A0ABD3A2G0_9GENT
MLEPEPNVNVMVLNQGETVSNNPPQFLEVQVPSLKTMEAMINKLDEWKAFSDYTGKKLLYVTVSKSSPQPQIINHGSNRRGISTGGSLIRDTYGELLVAYSNHYGNCSILQAEALGLLNGVKLCQLRLLMNVEEILDSLILVKALNGQIQIQ